VTRRLAAWTLRQALGPYRADTVLGDLDEELTRTSSGVARAAGPRLLLRAVVFAAAVRWAERQRPLAMMGSGWQDARHGIRTMRHRPGGFAAAVGMLGLAIGLTTAMFTVVDALLLRPVPFADPDRLVHLFMGSERGGPSAVPVDTYRAWHGRHAFAAVEATWSSTGLLETEAGEVAREVARVSPGLFDMVGGVRPVHGRLFGADDGSPGADDRILLSEELWRSGFGADATIVGQRVMLDDTSVVVVGILPDEFRFPDWRTALWRADSFESRGGGARNERVVTYARFAVDVPRDDALRLATEVAHEAGASAGLSAQARPLNGSNLDATDERAIRLLAGGVVLLFVVLCANVSSLLLAGLTSREHELGTRAALGATRGRLVGQASIESGLVGLAGVGAGLAVAWGLVSGARAVVPEAVLLQSLNPLNLDGRALVATSIFGFAAAIGAGVLPAMIGTRVNPSQRLQAAGRSGTASARSRLVARALLVGQVAISCTLLIGATVLVRSFVQLSNADRGLDVTNVLVARVSLTSSAYGTPDARADAARAIIDHARTLPGISHASWSYGTPPVGAITYRGTWTPEGTYAGTHVEASSSMVDAQYFPLYGVGIVRGRAFMPSDGRAATVLSERLARAIFGDEDPVGRHVTFDGEPVREVIQIVGVARDVHLPSLDSTRDAAELYRQFDMSTFTPMLSLRCQGACPGEGEIRRHLAAVQPAADISSISAVERWYLRELARPRAAAALAFLFALTALVAAGAGLFSLLSYAVMTRRREFGIRSALGASAASLRGLVWRDGLVVVVVGVGLGILGGAALTRVMTSLLYGVTMADPVNWAIVIGTIVVAAAAATWRPARTAVRADPLLLLREE
jgi:predicted permease